MCVIDIIDINDIIDILDIVDIVDIDINYIYISLLKDPQVRTNRSVNSVDFSGYYRQDFGSFF